MANYIIAGFIGGAVAALWIVGGIYFTAESAKRKFRRECYLTKKEVREMEKASQELKKLGTLEGVDVESTTRALDRIVYSSDLKEVII